MKFKCTRPFIAFGKNPKVGEIVELTDGQAAALCEVAMVAPYEIKILPLPENKLSKKQSESVPVARRSRGKTAKRSRKTAKKS